MISPESRAQNRRPCYAENWKIGTLAGELGVHPDTVCNAIEAKRLPDGSRSRSGRQRRPVAACGGPLAPLDP
jgi:hypothetical protein